MHFKLKQYNIHELKLFEKKDKLSNFYIIYSYVTISLNKIYRLI